MTAPILSHAQMLSAIVEELLARNPLLETMQGAPVSDVTEMDFFFPDYSYRLYYAKVRASKAMFLYRDPAHIPFLYYAILGVCPAGYVLKPIPTDMCYDIACEGEVSHTVYLDQGLHEGWMPAEYTTHDSRGYIGWSTWSDEQRYAYIKKRYPSAPLEWPVQSSTA